ncbi:hypothetical protein A8709_20080 [Paenibacillus pectinilyticus]|uniref:Uncharacterized protein n=1 Tax=Paenibacillus pectinilyticus TaxID=512399 RepID=A0A1C1A0H0_9BACL|nr:hypothetical protein [Paenibacillus pectinilyticus]OCT13873.1 hypothetical protein A8709_20080 [Paenibacillus pectinilyticus]
MSKKLQDNGLWESSRMMLPQHREAFQSVRHDKPVPTKRPTADDIGIMREAVLLPLMHTIIVRKANEMERSSEMLRALYAKVALVLAKNMKADLAKVKRHMLENGMSVCEEEKDDQMIRYRYTCREHEDRFTMTRDYLRAEIGVRIGRYADSLVTTIYGTDPRVSVLETEAKKKS